MIELDVAFSVADEHADVADRNAVAPVYPSKLTVVVCRLHRVYGNPYPIARTGGDLVGRNAYLFKAALVWKRPGAR